MRLPTTIDRYPAKMVSHLAERLVKRYASGASALLDPFSGSGAVLVAASRAGIAAYGMDLNPIAGLFCRVKLRGFESRSAERLAARWIKAACVRQRITCPVDWDQKNYWFTPGTLRKLELLRSVWPRVVGDTDSRERDAVLLAYTLSIRLCSRADQRSPKPFISGIARETRAGRHFAPSRTMLAVLRSLSALYGVRRTRRSVFERRDVSDLTKRQRPRRLYSHVITSPPYINAQDYFRNFKLELYLLEGLLRYRVDQLIPRFIGTDRGPLTDGIPSVVLTANRRLVRGLVDLEARAPRSASVVHRYFHKMSAVCDVLKVSLRPGGRLVLVCGDNLIAGHRIRTWKCLEHLLRRRGFRLRDRFSDPIGDRMLPPKRSGHRGLIKEEVVSVFQLSDSRRIAARKRSR